MADNEKAFVWSAKDWSDGEEILEKFAAKFMKVDDAKDFKEKFNAARVFNATARDGKDEELVWAEVIEDIEEKEEDDIDTNKTADADGEAN